MPGFDEDCANCRNRMAADIDRLLEEAHKAEAEIAALSNGIRAYLAACRCWQRSMENQNLPVASHVAVLFEVIGDGLERLLINEKKRLDAARVAGFNEGLKAAEPDVGRVADGVSNRVHRLRCLGNAVVPQIVELIGRAIREADVETKGA